MIDALNDQFGIDGRIRFESGENGFVRATISGAAQGEIYLHGAHVTKFQPNDHSDILWLSPDAVFRADKAIRGGIPVCWPWFGPHPSNNELPQHGFARTQDWSVTNSAVRTDGALSLTLNLTDNETTLRVWPHQFELSLTAVFGDTLTVELTATNCDPQDLTVGAALHSYFRIDDIHHTQLTGLDGNRYLDQLDQKMKQQHGPVTFSREVDRIYLETEGAVGITNDTGEQSVRVEAFGSRSTVIWNPWTDKAQRMSDFPDTGFRSMVCIETANAGGDERVIQPSESHRLRQTIVPWRHSSGSRG